MMRKSNDAIAVMAFTEDQVQRLTGLSPRRLRYWRDTGFFAPSFGKADVFYSFRDLVGLRTIALLRKKQVPLQELRKIGSWLKTEHETPWASLTFYLGGKTVFIEDPAGAGKITRGGQIALSEFAMEKIVSDTLADVKADRGRRKESVGKIEQRRGVMGHQKVVAGTRIRTASIWDLHEAGYTVEAICAEYPSLTAADVAAALEHERARRKAS